MNTPTIKELYFKDTSFADLMRHRIYNVLLYASKYDIFVLEEDGRIDELMFNEYTALQLRYPPRFTLVSSEEEANKALEAQSYELIISMPGADSINPFEWAKTTKEKFPTIPFVILTPFSKKVSRRMAKEDLSGVDYVFSWLGNSNLLMAIIKLVEDSMNIEEDVQSVGVQVIMLVEDAVHNYSSILPQLYQYVFSQSRSFMTEALNAHQQMLRMRGRPKIVLARNYEEAMGYYKQFHKSMLGVISDVSFQKDGKKTTLAGYELCQQIREQDKYIPLIMNSADWENKQYADEVSAAFRHKRAKSFMSDLKKIIQTNFGFGDFVFRHPVTNEIEGIISNLKGLQSKIFEISDKTLYYHLSHNNISRWLYSRAMFPLAEFLKNIHITSANPEEINEAKKIIFNAIVSYRRTKNRGVVAVFERDRFDKYSNFARIGNGSMGGKGRGLAFIDAMIKRNESLAQYPHTEITIPRTLVICTDIFAEFMEINDLYPQALSDIDDEAVLNLFLKARLPRTLIADLYAYLSAVDTPIAVRSSSLLEDSHYQPFAGVYSTYMVPYDKQSKTNMLRMLTDAIKAVYASVYYKSSKAYMTATQNVIDEEKMGLVLQEICGDSYGNRFYPSFSGVMRSLNFYPIGVEKTEDGIANIALGLGKFIVDGGVTLRFSPKHPHNILQTSTLDMALRETQTYFNALDLSDIEFSPQVDDSFNLLKINVQDAMPDGTLKFIASTFSPQDQVIYDNLWEKGRRVITFANILQHDAFPLAEILQEVLRISSDEMGRPVEIEFAVNLDYSDNSTHKFYLLQIRPIVEQNETINEDLSLVENATTIINSQNALGHGITNDIFDLIYVKPEQFNASKNQLIAYDIEKWNKIMQEENRYYVLIGPGRWGSSDTWLGIPVKWAQICNAKIICESGLERYRIDPSQGTHFFQNLTSLGVAYLTINPFENDGFIDIDYLNSLPAVSETEYVRHVRFTAPIIAKVDGMRSLGVVSKPLN